MSYCVTAIISSPSAWVVPFFPVWMQMGTYSSRGPGAITTPAACTDA